jgi:hypothetical protein
MNRRRFLLVSTGVLSCGGGLLWASAAYARNSLRTLLVEEAAPVLSRQHAEDLQRLPQSASEQLRIWFHGPCLNAVAFAREISSLPCLERLRACPTRELREQCVLNAFTARVVSTAEILNRVDQTAEAIGAELDRGAAACYRQIAERWDRAVRPYGRALSEDFSVRIEDAVRQTLAEALREARAQGEMPAAGETITEVGKAAIQLLPLAPVAPELAIPVFFLSALGPLMTFVLTRAGAAEAQEDLQAATSAQLALLARDLGAAFESEVRTRIVDFQGWQTAAVAAAADHYAREAVDLV